jgi:site-specific DNA recombinase
VNSSHGNHLDLVNPELWAMYLRMSTDEVGDDEGNGRQRDGARAYLRELGVDDCDRVREYVDVQSGYSSLKKRPDFERLIADIEAGLIRFVVARSYDRLTRNHRDAVRLLDAFRAGKVRVYLTDDDVPDLTTPEGEDAWWKAIEAGRAESARQSQRRRKANARRRDRGQLKVGQRAFGYRWTGSAKRYTLAADPVEAPFVATAFERIAAGHSVHGTAQWLNDRGVTGTRGGRWNSASLGYLLKNPLYAGRLVHQGEIVNPGQPDESMRWPALVDPERFDAVQLLLAVNRGAGQRGRPPRHLLTNLVETTDGVPMVVQTNNGRLVLRTKSGVGPVRNAAAVEKFVVEIVVERLGDIDLAHFVRRGDRALLAELTQQRRATLDRRAENDRAYKSGEVSPRLAGAADIQIERELDALEGRIAGLHNAIPGSAALRPYADRPDQAAAIWADSSLDDRRNVIRALFKITAGYRTTRPDDGRVLVVELDEAESGAPSRVPVLQVV